jgi:pyruvate,water dikinase
MNPVLKPSPVPIVPPPVFPVTWQNPQEAEYHWTRDREHIPQPITPMFSSVAALTASAGRAPTVELYAESILGRLDLQINTCNYTRLVPFTGSRQELEARGRENRKRLNAVIFNLRETWEQEWLPALQDCWQFWAAFDLRHASLVELTEHLERTLEYATRLYEIHYRMGPPMRYALDEFTRYYTELFPGTTSLEAHRLLQGFDNQTLRIGRALYDLSQQAADIPTVAEALLNLPADKILSALQHQAESKPFIQALNCFLEAYGQRSDLWDWGYPSWLEAPRPVLNTLRNYLLQARGGQLRNPRLVQAEAAAAREQAVAQARRALLGYPHPLVDHFENLLEAAQRALVLTEEPTYYIDFNGFGWVRQVILEVESGSLPEGSPV